MTPTEYATHKVNPDYEYNFSEFDEVINPREIKQITNIVRNALNAGTEGREIAILTARAREAEGPIRDYLESIGLDTSKITFELLGSSDPADKAAWIANRIENGATDVLFFLMTLAKTLMPLKPWLVGIQRLKLEPEKSNTQMILQRILTKVSNYVFKTKNI